MYPVITTSQFTCDAPAGWKSKASAQDGPQPIDAAGCVLTSPHLVPSWRCASCWDHGRLRLLGRQRGPAVPWIDEEDDRKGKNAAWLTWPASRRTDQLHTSFVACVPRGSSPYPTQILFVKARQDASFDEASISTSRQRTLAGRVTRPPRREAHLAHLVASPVPSIACPCSLHPASCRLRASCIHHNETPSMSMPMSMRLITCAPSHLTFQIPRSITSASQSQPHPPCSNILQQD